MVIWAILAFLLAFIFRNHFHICKVEERQQQDMEQLRYALAKTLEEVARQKLLIQWLAASQDKVVHN